MESCASVKSLAAADALGSPRRRMENSLDSARCRPSASSVTSRSVGSLSAISRQSNPTRAAVKGPIGASFRSSKYLGQKPLQPLGLRVLKDLLGRAGFHDLSVIHENDGV